MSSITSVFIAIAALACYAQAGPLMPESDGGNCFVLGVLENMFNATGCYKTCDKQGVCPNDKVPMSQTSLKSCATCVLTCAKTLPCYISADYTKEQLIADILGTTAAIYIDGCRIAEAAGSACTASPYDSIFQYALPSANPVMMDNGCPDPLNAIGKQSLTGSDLASFCASIKCRHDGAIASAACQRGKSGISKLYGILMTRLGCSL